MSPRWALRAALLALAMAAAACRGPSPRVTDVRLVTPTEEDAPYRIDAEVENRGGQGQVEVTLRLRDRRSGAQYQRDEHLELGPGERARIAVEIHAPHGGDYEAEVQAKYPPE